MECESLINLNQHALPLIDLKLVWGSGCFKNTFSGITQFCNPTGWNIVLVGSRFTHPAESRYSPIEGEALAVADALDKTHHFVLGCHNLIVAIDHKSLLKVFGDRALEDIPNTRLRNLKEKTLRYRFTMHHIPGRNHLAPDSLVTRQVPPTQRRYTYLMMCQQFKMIKPMTILQLSHSNHLYPQLAKNLFSGIRCVNRITDEFKMGIKIPTASTMNSSQSITWDTVRVATHSDDSM